LTKVVAVLGPARGFEIIERYKGVSGRHVSKRDDRTEVTASKRFPKLEEGGKK
jgi:hypothetical protein